MAFPTLQSSTTTVKGTAGTSHVLSNPSGSTTGSLVIHRFTTDGVPTFTWSTGWTSIIADTSSGTATRTGVRYRVLDGTGDDSCTVTTSSSVESACVSTRHTGYDTTTPCINGVVTADFGSDPDPPNSNPGSAADYAWQSGFGADDDDETASYTSASHTGIAQAESSTNATSCMHSAQYRNLNASSLNPAGMHLGAEEDFVTYTFAIKPGSGAESGGSITGTIAVTEAADTTAIAATETFSGTIAVTEANDSTAITGVETFTGTIAVTEDADSTAIVGVETFTGTIEVTEVDDTTSIDAITGFTGTIAITEADDTTAVSAVETFSGTISATEDADVCEIAASNLLAITGTIAVTESDDLCEITASVGGDITGTIAVTEDNDSGLITATVTSDEIAGDGLDPKRLLSGGSIGRKVSDPRVQYVSTLKGYFSSVQEWPQYQRRYARELEREIEEITPEDPPEDIEQLVESIQSLVQLLAKPKTVEPVKIEAIEPMVLAPDPPPIPPMLIQKLTDMIAKEKSDNEDDELIIMMLLQ